MGKHGWHPLKKILIWESGLSLGGSEKNLCTLKFWKEYQFLKKSNITEMLKNYYRTLSEKLKRFT